MGPVGVQVRFGQKAQKHIAQGNALGLLLR